MEEHNLMSVCENERERRVDDFPPLGLLFFPTPGVYMWGNQQGNYTNSSSLSSCHDGLPQKGIGWEETLRADRLLEIYLPNPCIL